MTNSTQYKIIGSLMAAPLMVCAAFLLGAKGFFGCALMIAAKALIESAYELAKGNKSKW